MLRECRERKREQGMEEMLEGGEGIEIVKEIERIREEERKVDEE